MPAFSLVSWLKQQLDGPAAVVALSYEAPNIPGGSGRSAGVPDRLGLLPAAWTLRDWRQAL
jgi:hypothetical protein